MERRGGSGQPVKGQRESVIRPKARKTPTAPVSTANLQEQLDQRTRELEEALDQQTASAEILKGISHPSFDLQTVFDTIVVHAVHLCHAHMGAVHRFDGKLIHIVALHNFPPEAVELLRRMYPRPPQPDQASGRAILTRKVAQIEDMLADRQYTREVTLAGQWGSILAVPMLRDGAPIGAIVITRNQVGRFTDRHIDLLKTFADQAVIAIENARLFNGTKEALEQQTATSEVLQVISTSSGELQPVFETVLESATRLCAAKFGNLYLVEGDAFRLTAMHNVPAAFAEVRMRDPLVHPESGSALRRLISTKEAVHISDVTTEQGYIERQPRFVTMVELGGFRSMLAVPMLKDGSLVGAVVIYRQEISIFSDKQIELVKSFAAQAVIAIENTRLLNELRQRTDDLSEALEQQTATSEVLKIISSSTGELEPVFDAMLANATRICEAKFGVLYLREGTHFRAAATTRNAPPEYIKARKPELLLHPPPDGPLRRVTATKQVVQIADLSKLQSYVERHPFTVAAVELGHFRTALGVPMLQDGEVVGAITILRQEVRPFGDKQIELVQNFAAQAVIAIENTRLLNELRQRTDDLTESLEQQTATSEVLKAISSSPGDLKPVFEAMLANATHICAGFGGLFRIENGQFEPVAYHNLPEALEKHLTARGRIKPRPGSTMERVMRTKDVVHVVDLWQDADGAENPASKYGNARTLLGVPMLKDDELIGAIVIYSQEVRPFSDKQIELVTNFAAQAVIAIENTRLLNELRESLTQQTATADVLKVISISPGELEPVFQAMLENATRICDANFGIMWGFKDGAFRGLSWLGITPEFADYVQQLRVWGPETGLGQLARTKQTVHVTDTRAGRAYADRDPNRMAAIDVGGVRTFVAVPMLKDGELIGAIGIFRQEVRPFTDKQIDLVTNFAAQAVIAIENTRLLNELRQRTDDLTESLDQQTATSEVLKVISSSAGELEPVFNAMLENAVRICRARFGTLNLYDGKAFRNVALHNPPPEYAIRRGQVIHPHPESGLGYVARTKRIVHIDDIRTRQPYLEGDPAVIGLADLAGARTLVIAPMLTKSELVGAITIYRQEVRPFTDKQVELVKNFAAQAVIAIENARLLNELRTRTNELAQSVGELRALGEVSQAVNSTLELETVLTTIVGRAVELSHTDTGAIYVFDEEGKEFRLHATHGMSEAMIAAISGQHIGLGHGNVGAATAQRKPVQVADIRNEPTTPVNEIILREGYRGILVIPLLRPDQIIGALVVRRKTPGEFPQSTIDLLQTFADQSVVAIQNARLYENVETRTRELAKSLEDLRTTQDRLVQTQKLASLGQLTAGIAHEIKNPLNFVNNFSAVSAELIDELRQALAGANLDTRLRGEISEIADTLQGNLDKVVQHGKRADAIVKNMLLHSREGSGEHRVVDINALVEESLNLAYHGARAEKQGFTITLERSFDPAAGQADVFPQDVTRALLNLISNGFYAATKLRAEANGGYEPTLAAATKSLGDRVEITIRDNGSGIPPDVKEKMFNPFFTTKPAGEGTGLGLSICHDIIVKQHGGSIEVDTQPGEFTEIRVTLPRVAALLS